MAEVHAKPCFDFARGKCRYGNRCKFTHKSEPTSRAPPRKLCPYLGTPKGCFKAQQCKFSHEALAGDDTRTRPLQATARSRPRTELETGFREWTFLIPRRDMRFQVVEIGNFFKMGWDLASKEHTETGQQIIKKLAAEEGLAMIKALADEQADGVGLETRLCTFKDRTLPFFRTISHPDIQSSLILETPLETIFTFLFGPNGRRAINLFKATTSALGALASGKTAKDEELSSIAVTASLAVLQRIVELNQSAQVIAEFTSVVNDLSTIIPEQLLQAGSRSLDRLRKRLGVGAAMPLSGGCRPQQESHRPVFNLGQDLPGALSELGPRHDNDHTDIFDIKILPTTDEIQSARLEYIPSSDPTKHHLPGLPGLLDRQFRLLREDTVGQVRDAVQIELGRLIKPANGQSPPKRQNNGVRNIIYQDVALLRLDFDRKRGLQVVAEFDQPPALAKKGAQEREEWWRNTKQLQIDAFVCLVSSTGRVIFFSVCDPAPTPPPKRKSGEDEGQVQSTGHRRASDERPNLFKRADRATLMLSPVEHNSEDITWINGHLGKAHKLRQSIVEFPGILLPSFQPTLQALQKMSRTLDLPFAELIAPERQHAGDVDIPAPAYSRRPGFAFNLETLTGGEPLRFKPGQPFDDSTLREKSILDAAQQQSTMNALSSCLALIQGPPGTGKSYTGVAIIRALLKNRDAAKLGPIICVCYTNHALDQLLEHLVKEGVEQLIRLGSRSKSELLQELNLHHVSKEFQPTKIEGHEKYQLYGKLDIALEEIEELMPGLKDPARWSNVKDYLETHHNHHFQQLFGRGFDEHGFQEVHGKKFNVLNSWVKGAPKRITSTRPVSGLLNVDLKDMSGLERSALHKYWVQQCFNQLNRRFLDVLDSYRHITDSLRKCHQETNLRCLLRAQIIGVTTTGLARNLDILRRVRAKVVVLEEAAEILEAHTLTALLPSVEHAVLIGDHEQLRPQINNYEFQSDNPRGAKFSLDLSLFERLVHPQSQYQKLPYASLEVQRRMYPSIAELIRSTLYPKLQDHPSVCTYPEVEGMRKRLFWLDHNEKEDASPLNPAQSFSKTNAWEVEMTAALVSHLVRQGIYRNEDIAVLTPYLGQLQKLKKRLQSSFAIVVGDRDVEDMEAKGLEDNVGEETVAAQGNVRKTTLLNALRIASVDNFQGEEAKVIVISLVRSNDERKCGFLKTSNRINVLLSRARHGMYIIGNTHTARPVPMWDKVLTTLERDGNIGTTLALCCPRHKETPIEVSKPDDFSIFSPEGGCNRRCTSRLSCGHACVNKCHSEPLHMAVRCLERCQRIKKGCDHACPKVCGDPCDLECQVQVPNIGLPCGHVRRRLACHLAQVPETVQCQVLVETIMPGCKHTLKLPCAVPCDLLPCSKRCSLTLTCGHQCPSVCGEMCPEARYCQKCAGKSVKDTMVDYILGSTYAEIDLDESPCIVPSCGHILTLESMDGHMEIANYYNISDDTSIENSIVGLKSQSLPFSTSELKNCPMCRNPLRNINRYGRIVRRAWIDEATKKFIVWANARFVPLAAKMEQAESKFRESAIDEQIPKSRLPEQAELLTALDKLSLEPIRLLGSREQQIKLIREACKGNTRYKHSFLLRGEINRFLKEVDEAEQPISRIHALVQDARNHRGVHTEITDVPAVLQVRNRLLATVLLLRCDYAILSDFVGHGGGTSTGKNPRDCRLSLALNRKDCENLVQESQSRQQPQQAVEGLLYWTRFVALERGRSASLSDEDMSALVDRAHVQLQLARDICVAHRGQTPGMLAEVSAAEKMLREATFYTPVTNAEKVEVYAAMAQSFRGTGHWYHCANGHPFTVGECGMPMETARCPQCGATVGGTNHVPAAGVTRAVDMDAGFEGGGR
ncbi:MAG: hypothetical protein L6R40_005416 [Gallowayella cf. fulva]|nr:MAG: hypothetical protein L6R40_005416 [Xanthomendoza cf. fulva]